MVLPLTKNLKTGSYKSPNKMGHYLVVQVGIPEEVGRAYLTDQTCAAQGQLRTQKCYP